MREGPSRAEHLVQRVNFKTPAILFAVTSRSYLNWGGSATDELDYPGLHASPDCTQTITTMSLVSI